MTIAALGVRPATEGDLADINDLYNHYVDQAHVTFDLEPMSIEARRVWFGHYAPSGRHQLLVAVAADSLLGFATSSRYRPRPAYDTSVETSVYVAPHATGRRIGSQLYAALFQRLESEDVHRAYAGIALPNPASVALHERFGFRRVAHYTEQGFKFGRYWDVDWFERGLR